MTFPSLSKIGCRYLLRVGFVASLLLVSSYCTHRDKQTVNPGLTGDEAYLVDAYVRISEARDLRSVSCLESERLFVALDSTIDTARISNTIRELDSNPDRWIVVFRGIARALESDSAGNSLEVDR
jgi:hypothetical protein